MEIHLNDEGKSKRVRCNPIRRWTVTEEKSLIEFLLENRQFEKPTAQFYYKRFCVEKNVAMEWKLVRGKVRNLRSSYNKAKTWEGSAGAVSMNGDTIKGTFYFQGTLLKMCTSFYELDDIFGSRICESSVIEDTMAEYIIIEEDPLNEVETPLTVEVTQSSQSPPCTSSTTSCDSPTEITYAPTTSRKGIYSRTADSDIIKVQAVAMSFKKQKLEEETIARDRELAIRENEFILKQKELELKVRFEESFKEKELQSQEKLKILDLQMRERLAMEELKLKYK